MISSFLVFLSLLVISAYGSSNGVGITICNARSSSMGCPPEKWRLKSNGEPNRLRCDENGRVMDWASETITSPHHWLEYGPSDQIPATYLADRYVEVRIRTTKLGERYRVRGLLLYAKNEDGEQVGTWSFPDQNPQHFQRAPFCSNALLHATADKKPYTLRASLLVKKGTGRITIQALLKSGRANTGDFWWPSNTGPYEDIVLDEQVLDTPVNSPLWVEAGRGQSCTEACSALPDSNLVCNAASEALSSRSELSSDAVKFGCGWALVGMCSTLGPFISEDTSLCYFWSRDACVEVGAGADVANAVNCDEKPASGSNLRRLCPCSDPNDGSTLPPCVPGEKNCPCDDNNQCTNASDSDEELVCDLDNICRRRPASEGEPCRRQPPTPAATQPATVPSPPPPPGVQSPPPPPGVRATPGPSPMKMKRGVVAVSAADEPHECDKGTTFCNEATGLCQALPSLECAAGTIGCHCDYSAGGPGLCQTGECVDGRYCISHSFLGVQDECSTRSHHDRRGCICVSGDDSSCGVFARGSPAEFSCYQPVGSSPDQARCVIRGDCQAGSAGCECASGQSCDENASTPLQCSSNNVCIPPGATATSPGPCVPGQLHCACDELSSCKDDLICATLPDGSQSCLVAENAIVGPPDSLLGSDTLPLVIGLSALAGVFCLCLTCMALSRLYKRYRRKHIMRQAQMMDALHGPGSGATYLAQLGQTRGNGRRSGNNPGRRSGRRSRSGSIKNGGNSRSSSKRSSVRLEKNSDVQMVQDPHYAHHAPNGYGHNSYHHDHHHHQSEAGSQGYEPLPGQQTAYFRRPMGAPPPPPRTSTLHTAGRPVPPPPSEIHF